MGTGILWQVLFPDRQIAGVTEIWLWFGREFGFVTFLKLIGAWRRIIIGKYIDIRVRERYNLR